MADKQLDPSPTVDSGPATCKGCGKPLGHLVIEEIAGVRQLRDGNVLIAHTDANCMNCGWRFNWNVNEKELGKVARTYEQILVRIQTYHPE